MIFLSFLNMLKDGINGGKITLLDNINILPLLKINLFLLTLHLPHYMPK